jgi:hypothetical protein
LAKDQPLRDRLSAQGRKLAITKFDERIAARTALSAYKRALGHDS